MDLTVRCCKGGRIVFPATGGGFVGLEMPADIKDFLHGKREAFWGKNKVFERPVHRQTARNELMSAIEGQRAKAEVDRFQGIVDSDQLVERSDGSGLKNGGGWHDDQLLNDRKFTQQFRKDLEERRERGGLYVGQDE